MTAGMVSLNLENGEGIKLGGVTLHDMVVDRRGYGIGSVTAAILGVMVVCAGEAVLAKFAEICFVHALNAETPFTLDLRRKRCGSAFWQSPFRSAAQLPEASSKRLPRRG